MKVVLFSYHYYASRRRAGFHFVADAFARLGWDVVFVTAPISWLSKLGDDPRFQYPVRREAGHLVRVSPSIRSYVHFTPFHPANLRRSVLNTLSGPVFLHGYPRLSLGPLVDELRTAQLVVFESTPALILVDRVRSIASEARLTYRVSDDMESLRLHPVVRGREVELATRCDIVSTPSAYLHRRFDHLPNAHLHGHAIDKSVFDAPVPSPYTSRPNAVYLGFYQPDVDFLRAAAEAHPEVTFHLVGQRLDLGQPNIVSHGEVPFRDTLGFVKHADIGLHTVAYRPGAEALTDTLKVIQFSYCGIPIIMPAFLESSRPNVISYEPGGSAGAAEAVSAALALEVAPASDIPSWNDLATLLAG